jgi:hypothetical protein
LVKDNKFKFATNNLLGIELKVLRYLVFQHKSPTLTDSMENKDQTRLVYMMVTFQMKTTMRNLMWNQLMIMMQEATIIVVTVVTKVLILIKMIKLIALIRLRSWLGKVRSIIDKEIRINSYKRKISDNLFKEA